MLRFAVRALAPAAAALTQLPDRRSFPTAFQRPSPQSKPSLYPAQRLWLLHPRGFKSKVWCMDDPPPADPAAPAPAAIMRDAGIVLL